MATYQMGDLEGQFADIIWANEPVSSAKLAQLAEEKFEWRKTTSYTVLKRLCDKGIFRNVKATVTSCMTREEFYAGKSISFVEDNYGGSLPDFLASFLSGSTLTKAESEELCRVIKDHTKK